MGKEKNADKQHFLLFTKCFLLFPNQILPYQPFPNQQILDSSKLKEFTNDNFNFDENGRQFFKWVENTVEKGEIVHYKQFLLFPQCFQKTCTADT